MFELDMIPSFPPVALYFIERTKQEKRLGSPFLRENLYLFLSSPCNKDRR